MAKTEPEELNIPDEVAGADSAVEVLRVWVADGSLCVIFDPVTFQGSVGEWGRMLADVTHHIANGVAMQGEMSQHEALTAVRQAYDRSLPEHVTTRSGRIKGRTAH